ncbi:respiratory nitrate reductase chaperone NarJ [Limimonas halophila]|uniref:Respiratory nitrate reductase chaperone NarJ n=1 Tax=Limimonas halophila TaxID=1082479 RepID=A0A1G7NQK4_9PROT|nr:nitrate reductase molybdenum cofactor assembly chaperone [Limimonas halophila]SDF76197.1 respiratory nitrate reductase chaperone NarJ [Limimonas halophila]
MYTCAALAALLNYPTAELQQAVRDGEIARALRREGLVPRRQREALKPLLDELATWDLLDLQSRYVALFDRSRARSLHLFEHVHGESRDRGEAMVQLQQMYAQAGLELAAKELPDYLPLYLEYCSVLAPEEACQRLSQPIHVIAGIRSRLKERGSSYAPVFEALEALSAQPADAASLEQILKEGDDEPDDTERLDREWAEDPVSFGPDAPGTGGNSCGRIKQIAERVAAATTGKQAHHADRETPQ